MRINGRLRATTAVAALVVAGLAVAASPAQAAEKPRGCVANLVTKTTTCFSSFREAIAYATAGRVTDAPNNAAAAMRDSSFEAKLNATTVGVDRTGVLADTVISIEYDDPNFGGDHQIWSANNGCSTSLGNVDHEDSDLNGNVNVISSYRTYANCWVKHYENTGFGGASIGYLPTDSYIGAAMDNRASSIRWS